MKLIKLDFVSMEDNLPEAVVFLNQLFSTTNFGVMLLSTTTKKKLLSPFRDGKRESEIHRRMAHDKYIIFRERKEWRKCENVVN